ncbi:Competence protein ComM [Anaplasma phagocytophilum]|uniref:YifB family Mg chelatase-like AAA ATPase n=1 Tax=Anaplasma phagocytophilum TaxID=948 RepID=UPI0007DE77A4|nr:YifB family Mg chelatase-like AAA ATPase [Anaplasma phagocytophilum]SCV66557.1 Competence protein ComM [Anaplasma phagocytophilum]
MLADVNTVAFVGVCTVDVIVQVHIANGIPSFHIVGMPDKVVAESRERIRAALTSIKAPLPQQRITVNLSPASLFKEGSHYDLPIVMGILSVMKIIKESEKLSSYIMLGELSLDGSITAVKGVLAAAVCAKNGSKGIICPYGNAREASLIAGLEVLGPRHLSNLVHYFSNNHYSANTDSAEFYNTSDSRGKEFHIKSKTLTIDMGDVLGQEIAKRAALIAAAGEHNLLMIGPPGTGKSMIAKRIPGILPDLTPEEIIAINVISSITQSGIEYLITSRPFREPHSSASMPSIVGGGMRAHPGEITLAHNGILFLDELPEFSKSVLEALRQPLEDKSVVIARANSHITYPANFQLVAAMNPCKCGYLNDPNRRCSRAPKCAIEYQRRISGPILSRIDIKVEMGNVSVFSKITGSKEENSSEMKRRVVSARLFQERRYGDATKRNAFLSAHDVESFVIPYMCSDARRLLEQVFQRNQLSNRDSAKILKVARTIADLSCSEEILEEHVAEAISLFGHNVFCL